MPGAVTQAGFADEVLPLDRVAEAITRLLPHPRPGAGLPRAAAAAGVGGAR
jgi:two-component system chemotaxis response regulator CheB